MKHFVLLSMSLHLLLGTVAAGQTESGKLGEKAPAFELEDVRREGRSVRSQEVHLGNTTLLSFFATWCRPCKGELPFFNSLAQRYADRGFQVIVISLDRDKRDVESYLKQAHVEHVTVLWDGERTSKGRYGVTQLPTNVRIDPDGTVGERWFGDLPEKLHELEAYLQRLPRLSP